VYRRLLIEGVRPLVGPVDDLVGDDQMAGFEFLTQAADRAGGENMRATQLLERENVGPEGDLRGVEQMPRSVARQQKHRHAGPGGFDDGVARPAEGRVYFVPRHAVRLNSQRLPQSGSTDQSNAQFTHAAEGKRARPKPQSRVGRLADGPPCRTMPVLGTIQQPGVVVLSAEVATMKLSIHRAFPLLLLCLLGGCLVSANSKQKVTGNYVPESTFEKIEPG
jgi:hypothetical protein